MPTPLRLLLVSAADAPARPRRRGSRTRPPSKTLYADGPSGRYLLGGEWLFRLDKEDVGLKQRFQRQTGRDGWTPVQVPHAWNVGDDSPESMAGATGWYRKDFSLAERGERAELGRALRVGQLPHRGCGSTASRSAPTRAPTSRSSSCSGASSAAARTGSWSASTRAASDRLPALGPDHDGRADRRLVELRRAAARGLPAPRRPHRLEVRPRHAGPAVRHVRGHRQGRGHAAQPLEPRRPRTHHRRSSATRKLNLGTVDDRRARR